MQILTKFFIVTFAIVYFTNKFSIIFSNIIRSNLSHLQTFSAIQLTEQDNKNIIEQKSKKSKRIFSVGFTIFLTITYGIISSVLATKYFQ